ncbi:MAG: hypothetical protein H6999_05400 [Hahellaceae bacterium]|nr:hypothetical protein [Hahellaceae bacterium]MCP5169174.1 hypothetical protein [Hahellaceae bacterium]
MRAIDRYLPIILLTLSLSFPAQAFNLVLGKPEISTLLTLVFPYQSQFGEWQVRMSDPQPEFNAGQQRIALGVSVSVKDSTGHLQAWGKVGGTLMYDKPSRQLQLMKPELLDFKVKQGKIEKLDPMLEQLKANLKQQLPLIILVDLNQINPGLAAFNPSAVRVVAEGIAVEF